jgi:sensor histidine kinase regulating citrate/malate metabolism
MKNNMEVLQNLLKRKYLSDGSEDNEIKHYFDGMYTSVEQLDNRVHTGSAVSDAVINSKFRYAEKEITNIRLDAGDFILPDNINIQAYDIGIILNNGLDNAIEACKKMHIEYPASKTFISVRSFCKRNMFFIEVENSFDGFLKIDKDSGYPVSTKEESKSHGIGLRNIKNCAKKYAGDIDCIAEDKKFILSVMLKN